MSSNPGLPTTAHATSEAILGGEIDAAGEDPTRTREKRSHQGEEQSVEVGDAVYVPPEAAHNTCAVTEDQPLKLLCMGISVH